MKTLKALWCDESGAIVSTEIVLVITILGIGMIVGLAAVRNSVVTELADVGQAVSNINQSYSYSGTQGHAAQTAGSQLIDAPDFCDGADPGGAFANSKCLVIGPAATPEGTN